MKIGLDARWIFRETSGIGTYTRELIRHLARLDGEHEVRLYFNDRILMEQTAAELGWGAASRFTGCLLPYGLFSVRGQLALPRRLRDDGLDVFHSPNYLVPLLAFPRRRPGPVRCVVTLHDLIPLVHPEYAPRARKRRLYPLYRRLMLEVAARADLILTVSRASRDDILRHMNPACGPERVLAIPEGVSPRFTPGSGNGPVPEQKTILWVGRADPYKNLAGLVDAFADLREQSRLPVSLRLVGPKDRRYPEAEQRAAARGVAGHIVWLGYVSEDRLLEEYRRADVLALPSFYEGFGLPVLEAMACGTPVICSNRGALPEVSGDAALKVQPQDRVGLAEALRRILTDRRLARDLRERGLRQAARFSWDTTARQTLGAYRQALEAGGSS